MPRGAGRWAIASGGSSKSKSTTSTATPRVHFRVRNRAGAAVVLYAALALLVVPVFPHFLSPNEVTRWAFAASLVERRTPEISGVLPLLGPAFEDVSEKDGRVYSNKAPGAALVALPGYLAARPFAGPPSATSLRPSLTLMRLCGAPRCPPSSSRSSSRERRFASGRPSCARGSQPRSSSSRRRSSPTGSCCSRTPSSPRASSARGRRSS